MKKLPQIKVSFVLTSQQDHLQKITDTLSIQPNKTRKKEEFRLAQFACYEWVLTTGKQHSKCVDFQSEEILKHLNGKEKLINELIRTCDLKPDFIIVIEAEMGDGPEINLSKAIIKFAAQINAEIGFDVYFE